MTTGTHWCRGSAPRSSTVVLIDAADIELLVASNDVDEIDEIVRVVERCHARQRTACASDDDKATLYDSMSEVSHSPIQDDASLSGSWPAPVLLDRAVDRAGEH